MPIEVRVEGARAAVATDLRIEIPPGHAGTARGAGGFGSTGR